MKRLILASLISLPALAQTTATLSDWGCPTATVTQGNPTIINCSTPHGFGNGWHAWVYVNFKTNPVNGDTITLDTTTYTFVNTLTNTTPNQIQLSQANPTGYTSSTAYNFNSAVNGDAGSGTAYSSATSANATMSAVWDHDTTIKVYTTAGGPTGAGKTVTTTSTHITITNGDGTQTATVFGWYVGLLTPASYSSGSWQQINNQFQTSICSDVDTTGLGPFCVADPTLIVPGGTYTIAGAGGAATETFTGASISGNQVTFATRSGSSYHSSGDYTPYDNGPADPNYNPNVPGGSQNVAGPVAITGDTTRVSAWYCTYRDANSCTIQFDSTGAGFTTLPGTISVFDKREADNQAHGPLINNVNYANSFQYGPTSASAGSGTWNLTISDGAEDDCVGANTLALLQSCRNGYYPPYPQANGGPGVGSGAYQAFTNLVVSGGSGAITLTTPFNQAWGTHGAGDYGDVEMRPGRIVWLQGMTDPTLDTYFLVTGVTLSSGTAGCPTPTNESPCVVTAITLQMLKRDGTTVANNTYTGPKPQIFISTHADGRWAWQPQGVGGASNAWGMGMGYQTKDATLPDVGNIHVQFCQTSGGNVRRNGDNTYHFQSFGTFVQTRSDLLIWKGSCTSCGINNEHWYMEPSPFNDYKNQQTCLDLGPAPFTQRTETGQEVQFADPTFGGSPYVGGWNPESHLYYHMYNWYYNPYSNDNCQNGTCTGGTWKYGKVTLNEISAEPDEMIQSTQCGFSTDRYIDGLSGYECNARMPKNVTGWTMQVHYSTAGSMKTSGFSTGNTDCMGHLSNCVLAYNSNTSAIGVPWYGTGGQSQANQIWIGFRPVPGIGGCTNQASSRCSLNQDVDPGYAAGDHITISGVLGNTAVNTCVGCAISSVLPRKIYPFHSFNAFMRIAATALSNNGGNVQVHATQCCEASEPWAFHAGDTVSAVSGSLNSCPSNPCANNGYVISSVVDNDDFVVPVAYTGQATAGSWTQATPPSDHLISVVATGGGVGSTCTATFSTDPQIDAGNWITAIGIWNGPTSINNMQITSANHVAKTLTFACPNVGGAGTTYTTDFSGTGVASITIWPTFVIPVAGNGAYTPCGTNSITSCSGTVVATDDTKNFAERTFGAPPTGCTINTGSLPNGVLNIAYSQTISVSNCGASPTFAVSAGTLPTGLSLGSSTGTISGTPTSTNGGSPFNFTVSVNGGPPSQAYSVTIAPNPSVVIGGQVTIKGQVHF